jgi:hypothetical protein
MTQFVKSFIKFALSELCYKDFLITAVLFSDPSTKIPSFLPLSAFYLA